MGFGVTMLPLKIAIRYLLAPKSHNAINAITIVAAFGVAIITAALICVLSVFNGFEDLVGRLTSRLDPELKIMPLQGKTFQETAEIRAILDHCPAIETYSTTLQETVLIIYGGRQIPAQMKGVDSIYQQVTEIDSILWNGTFTLKDPVAQYAILGVGLSQQVACRPGFLRPMTFYCPRRKGTVNLLNPEDAFVEQPFYCSAQFAVQQSDYDDNLCLVDLQAARTLLEDSLLCSAFEIKVREGSSIESVKRALEEPLLKHGLTILNRQEQQADNYRIVQIEKWITFLLILFILLIASFNIIGALSMLIIDKEAEIRTLQFLGADTGMIRQVFALEGWLISGTGAIFGIILGTILCLLQEQYGLIGLGDGSAVFVIDSYPVRLIWSDVLWVIVSVLIVGLFTTLIPIGRIKSNTEQ